jgi:hypothetical protein
LQAIAVPNCLREDLLRTCQHPDDLCLECKQMESTVKVDAITSLAHLMSLLPDVLL